jgi:flagellar biosynthesis protein FlhG
VNSPVSGPRPKIIAIASGKGGVGKSVILTNLALLLARHGKRVLLLDADLGGANLHTMLGVDNPTPTLTDFLTRQVADLSSTVVPTPFENLSLISGANALMDMANPYAAQKAKLLRHLAVMDVDYVLIDLGAGSTFTTLDFLAAAHRTLMVLMPTPTSIENAYHLLKAVLYRKIVRTLKRLKVEHRLPAGLEEDVRRGRRPAWDMLSELAQIDPAMSVEAARLTRQLRPQIIVNHANSAEDLRLGRQVVLSCQRHLGLDADFLGDMRTDERVLNAVQQRRPVCEVYPGSPFATALEGIALRLLNDTEKRS